MSLSHDELIAKYGQPVACIIVEAFVIPLAGCEIVIMLSRSDQPPDQKWIDVYCDYGEAGSDFISLKGEDVVEVLPYLPAIRKFFDIPA